MKKIKFGLSTTQLLLSKTIRLIQGTPFSHSFIEFDTAKYETTLIYEAKGFNSYIINKVNFHGEIVEEFEVEVSDELFALVVKFILGDIGVEYAWAELFGLVFVRMARSVGFKVRNPWPRKGKICSEACGEILVKFFGVLPDVAQDDMDLVWLSSKLKSHPQFKMIKG